MKNIKSIIVLLIIVFSACTERMDIDVNDAPPQLAIYGSITTDAAQHIVTIRRSSNYFSNAAPEGISGAMVTISDGENVFVLSENSAEKGVYQTAPDVFGVEGKTYTLTVVAAFNGETAEYAATSFLPYSVQVDSVAFQPSEVSANSTNVLLYGKFHEKGNNYLNIIAYKNNNIPLNDKLADFNIISSENTDSREINGANCMRIRTEQYEDRAYIERGDLVTIQVCSITKDYADYVLNAQKELQGSIPIFSGPPANVQTNISGGAVGFFTAYSKSSGKVVYE
jgi:hypothetical protein